MKLETFVWSDAYGVGVSWIDEQHEHFFDIVNHIVALTTQKKIEKEDVFVRLGELNDHILYHFDAEETYLKESKFPDVEAHLAAHDAFRKEIKEFTDDIENGKRNAKKIADDTATFASDWLKKHMLGMDKERVQYLRQSQKNV